MRQLLDERMAGTRQLLGTRWVVTDQLTHVQMPGRRATWVITLGLCNGIPSSGTEYRTRKAALAAWAELEQL